VKILQERIFANDKTEVLWDTVIEEISGEEKFESITIKNVKVNKTSKLELDGLFISIGMDSNTEFVKGFVDLDEWGQIKVSQDMSTSQPGIFAAGDVTDTCPEQMATAVGTGVAAALTVDEYLSEYK